MSRFRLPRLKFRHVLIAGAAFGAANLPVVRSAWLHFGATESELDAVLPGDHLIEHANLVATRSVTISAPPDEVWGWLVQIGADRGGFYSYDGVENLIGCEVHSAEEIQPEWQHLEPGEQVSLHPSVWMDVVDVIPERSLVLRSPKGSPTNLDFSWEFALRRSRHHSTRLVIRERYGYRTGWAALIAEPMALVSFVMTEKMMRTIRERAELAHGQTERTARKTAS